MRKERINKIIQDTIAWFTNKEIENNPEDYQSYETWGDGHLELSDRCLERAEENAVQKRIDGIIECVRNEFPSCFFECELPLLKKYITNNWG